MFNAVCSTQRSWEIDEAKLDRIHLKTPDEPSPVSSASIIIFTTLPCTFQFCIVVHNPARPMLTSIMSNESCLDTTTLVQYVNVYCSRQQTEVIKLEEIFFSQCIEPCGECCFTLLTLSLTGKLNLFLLTKNAEFPLSNSTPFRMWLRWIYKFYALCPLQLQISGPI